MSLNRWYRRRLSRQRGTLERESKYGRQKQDGLAAAGRLVELNLTRPSTTPPVPKVPEKSLEIPRPEVFLGVHPSVQRARVCSRADDGTVGDQSGPGWMNEKSP